VQRCLAKRPEARYQSIGELAADLQAFNAGRAISNSSRRYRLRMFVRRHWLPLTAASASLLLLLGSTVAVLWQSRQIAHEAQNTLQVKNFLFGLFTAVDPHEAKGREVSARELLDRGAEQIAQDAALDTEQRAEIQATLGRTYYQLGLYDQATKLQQSALKALAADGTHELLRARTQSQRAETLLELGDLKSAAALAAEASAALGNLAGATPVDRARALRAQAAVALGPARFRRGQALRRRRTRSGEFLAGRFAPALRGADDDWRGELGSGSLQGRRSDVSRSTGGGAGRSASGRAEYRQGAHQPGYVVADAVALRGSRGAAAAGARDQ
jgi:tetratricopeptide (TPR) repeat protein